MGRSVWQRRRRCRCAEDGLGSTNSLGNRKLGCESVGLRAQRDSVASRKFVVANSAFPLGLVDTAQASILCRAAAVLELTRPITSPLRPIET